MKNWIYILIIIIAFSCKKSVKKFEIETDYAKSVIELFDDSTFIEQVKEDFDEYQFSGTWSGGLENDSEFTTKCFKLDGADMIFTPERIYQVENEIITWVNLYVDGLSKYGSVDSVMIANDIMKKEKIDKMAAHVMMQNINGSNEINFNLINEN